MKAFSRIPDHFGQHLENVQFNFPFKMAIQIDAIPQGKFRSNVIQIGMQVNQIVESPNQYKHGILSLDMNDQLKDEIGKESQNTAITEGNPTSKELERKQKLVTVKKCMSEEGQKFGNFYYCEDGNIGFGSQKMMEVSCTKRVEIQQKQKLSNLAIESNTKQQVLPIVSHIVFSSKQQQIVKDTFHKRPIFQKKKQSSSVQKMFIQQQKFEEQIVDIRIEQKLKQTQQISRFLEKKQKVEEFIKPSFSNNRIFKKEGLNDIKDTGFDLIESVLNIFKNEHKQPQTMSSLDEKTRQYKQSPGHIGLNLINKKENLRNLRGKKPTGSRASQASSLQPFKLQLIQSITINPVFF